MLKRYIDWHILTASDWVNMKIEQRNIDAENQYDQPMFDLMMNWKALRTENSTCTCQILRSSSKWSNGLLEKERSIQNAYISLIERSERFIYIENQFLISNSSGSRDNLVKNTIFNALYKRIVWAVSESQTIRIYVFTPLLPGFEGDVAGKAAVLKEQIEYQMRTISKG